MRVLYSTLARFESLVGRPTQGSWLESGFLVGPAGEGVLSFRVCDLTEFFAIRPGGVLRAFFEGPREGSVLLHSLVQASVLELHLTNSKGPKPPFPSEILCIMLSTALRALRRKPSIPEMSSGTIGHRAVGIIYSWIGRGPRLAVSFPDVCLC